MATVYWIIGLIISVLMINSFFTTGNPLWALPGMVMLSLTIYVLAAVGLYILWQKIKWGYYGGENTKSTKVCYTDRWGHVTEYEYRYVKYVYIESGKQGYGILQHDTKLSADIGNYIHCTLCALPKNLKDRTKLICKCWPVEAEYVNGVYRIHAKH